MANELNAALVESNAVVNIIYISADVMAAWNASGKELLDASPLGLAIGDERRGGNWYRGEQQLPLPEPEIDTLQDMQTALETLGVTPEGE